MAHRPRTWWRAIAGAVVVALGTPLGHGAIAGAAPSPTPVLVHQQEVVTLGASGAATLGLTVAAARSATLRATLFPLLITRGALEGVVAGHSPGVTAIASTPAIPLRCARHGAATLAITVTTTRRAAVPTCDGARPRLRLACAPGHCDGVYPLRLLLDQGGTRTVWWSLVTVRGRGALTPLSVALIETLTRADLVHPLRTADALRAIARAATTPLTLGADYGALGPVILGKDRSAPGPTDVAAALTRALASGEHRAIDAPPAETDFAGLATHRLDTQVLQQVNLSSGLLRTLTGRYVDGPVLLSGPVAPTGLAALVRAGETRVVLAEGSLAAAPSSTLTWGTPFRATGVPGVLALATDGPLSALLEGDARSAGLRTAQVLGTLDFLHYEAPNAPAPRAVVLAAPLSTTSPTLINDLTAGLGHDPFVRTTTLTPLFDARLVGTDGAPATRALKPVPASTWSSRNVASLLTVIGEVNSFAQAVRNGPVATALRVAVASAEQVGPPGGRQAAIARAQAALDAQLGLVTIDASTITLAGPGTALPVTIHSSAGYDLAAVVHVSAEGLAFPKGTAVAVNLNAPTVSVDVPTARATASSVTLEVTLTTPNGQLELARSAVQVRIAGTSIVGYLLTALSLLVLAWWWRRTTRRRTAGRHAR